MSLSVQLDSEPAFRTIKVDNVSIYAELSAKLFPEELALLKALPEDSFGGSQGFAKLVSMISAFGCVVDSSFVLRHGPELCKVEAK
jgi:hypothetical protein